MRGDPDTRVLAWTLDSFCGFHVTPIELCGLHRKAHPDGDHEFISVRDFVSVMALLVEPEWVITA